MPRTIEKKPTAYSKNLLSVRINVDEVVSVLRRLNISDKDVQARSGNFLFDGLEDIESSPAAFSGEPRVVISEFLDKKTKATATVDFGKATTNVYAGEFLYDTWNQRNDELANKLYTELKPFSNLPEDGFRKLCGIGTVLAVGTMMGLLGYTFFISEDSPEETREAFGSVLMYSIIFLFLFCQVCSFILDRRLPVRFYPRETFLQRHIGKIAIAAISLVIGAIIQWYFFN